jgi:hypothetical protein
MLHTGQVTIPASGRIALSATRIPAYEVTIQNNDGNNSFRVGDATITAANAQGIVVAKSGTIIKFGPYTALSIGLDQIFVVGTQNGLVDFTYTK